MSQLQIGFVQRKKNKIAQNATAPCDHTQKPRRLITDQSQYTNTEQMSELFRETGIKINAHAVWADSFWLTS